MVDHSPSAIDQKSAADGSISKEGIFAAVMESSATEKIANAFKILEDSDDIRSTLTNFGMHYLHSILVPEIMAIRKMALNEADRSDIGRHCVTGNNCLFTGLSAVTMFTS